MFFKTKDTCQADSTCSWKEAGCYRDTGSTCSSMTQQSQCVDTKYVASKANYILHQRRLMHVQVVILNVLLKEELIIQI